MATTPTPDKTEENEEWAIQPAPMTMRPSNYTNLKPEQLAPIAEMMVKSGYFKDVTELAKGYVKILAGQEMGITPFAAMKGIHIIQGSPTVGANLMASKVKSSHKYNYKVKTHTNELCEIEFYELNSSKMELQGVERFSIEDARKAGTQNLQKFPKNMLFARAISNGVKFYCPDIFDGQTVYTAEEMGYENTDSDGAAIVPETPYSAAQEATEADVVDKPTKPRTQTLQEAVGELMKTIKDIADVDITRDDAVKVLLNLAGLEYLVDIKLATIPTIKVAVELLTAEAIRDILTPAESTIITNDEELTDVNLDDIPF
jgi:hypothetical protein